jgi:amidohydrolase
MHACGHDMHAAALAGAAAVLATMRAKWHGTIILIFQPSEEQEPSGAQAVLREGLFPSRPAAVFALHVTNELRSGQVGLKPGADFACVVGFDITVRGRGGHGAMPQNTIDPIPCAASLILRLQELAKRKRRATDPVVLTVGSVHAGERRNVIPDETILQGTIRTFSDKTLQRLLDSVRACTRAVARAHKTKVSISLTKSYPAGCNDPALTKRAATVLADLLGERNVVMRSSPAMYSDDMAYFLQKAPGVYLHLGVRPKGARATAPGIHSSRFLPQERALRTATAVHVSLALDMLAVCRVAGRLDISQVTTRRPAYRGKRRKCKSG